MVREATIQEKEEFIPNDNFETFLLVWDNGGEVEGHVAVSKAFGQAFGHSMKVWSDDRTVAARLWRAASTRLKSEGFTSVNIHLEPDTDPRVADFWKRNGYEKVIEILRGELK